MAKAHTLVDDFNDNAIDTTRWSVYQPSERVREVNRRIEIETTPNRTSESYRFLSSVVTYDLTDSEIRIEVLHTLSLPSTVTFLQAKIDNSYQVTLFAGSGQLCCEQIVGGSLSTLATVAYDSAAHRWWRIRESQGTTYWEASADGQDWTVLTSTPDPFSLTSVTLLFGAGTVAPVADPGVAVFDNFNVVGSSRSRRVEQRRLSAREVREDAAEVAAERRHAEHANNNDEVNYPGFSSVGNFSKGLRHDSVGDPEPASYTTLLRALESRDPGDFEEILLGPGGSRLVNPQAGLAFELEGADPQTFTQPPAPRFDSEELAHEMGELYWMALARDVPFVDYAAQASVSGSVVARAIQSLNNEFPFFGGTRMVTAQNLFRGIFPGEQVGPYVSQFLWKGNADPRKPDGQGRDADEGYITYGAQVIDQRLIPVEPGIDYLTDFQSWLNAQNGADFRGQDQFDTGSRRFIRSLRDGANYVHFDQVLNAFYNAAFILLSEPVGNQLGGAGAGRPQVDAEFALDQGNPYDPPGSGGDSRTQVGFATFGPVHLLQALCEVTGRAARAVWWQKWGVHRRLRPEEFGGRIDNHLTGRRTYPIQWSVLNSLQTGLLAPYFPEKWGSYLLPQAYPEGAPLHPAYGAGHATISGACATMLKAFFDEGAPIENPVTASADGSALLAYTGSGAGQMTVGGELNKLAGNIALFRNAAGVHWRTDYTESLLLGEQVAVGLLQEMSLTFNEDDAFFQLTRLNGTTIRIHDGRVTAVLSA